MVAYVLEKDTFGTFPSNCIICVTEDFNIIKHSIAEELSKRGENYYPNLHLTEWENGISISKKDGRAVDKLVNTAGKE